MPELPKIPVPWSQRWRSIRFRLLPLVVFALAAVGTTYLWNQQLSVSQAVGEVYARRIDLAVQYDGVLLDSPYRGWNLYDRVEAGVVLARLDDRPTLALIDTVRQELAKATGELHAAENEFGTTQDDREFQRASEGRRLAVEIENRRLSIADRRSMLATDEMELRRQEARFEIAERLTERKTPLMSQLDTMEIQRLRDVAKERIKGHKEYIAEAEKLLKPALARLDQQTAIVKSEIDRVLAPLRSAIAYQEARIRELQVQQRALEIHSPISGYIVPTSVPTGAAAQPIAAVPGQQVRAGTVIFTIAADEPEYIVSYVRPSQRLRPEVGMKVAIRPRNTNFVAEAQIERVGPQVEVIPANQLRDQKLLEWGLPVRIPVPPLLRVRPGEVVDLKFLPSSPGIPQAEDVLPSRG